MTAQRYNNPEYELNCLKALTAHSGRAPIKHHSGFFQHMKPAFPKGLRVRRFRRSMSTLGNAAAFLAAAWSAVPHRCCQAVRVTSSSSPAVGYHQFNSRRIATSASASGLTALQGGRTSPTRSAGVAFVPRVGLGRKGVATFTGARNRLVRKSLVAAVQQRIGPAYGVGADRGGRVRMVSDDSDESKFFTDPDAPPVEDGVGPPGPLGGGDHVSYDADTFCLSSSTALIEQMKLHL